MVFNLSLEQIGGVAAVIGSLFSAVLLALKKNGLITFGRIAERRSCPSDVKRICGDHVAMRNDIEAIKINSAARLEKLNAIEHLAVDTNSKVDSVAGQVAQISGYLQGRNGFRK